MITVGGLQVATLQQAQAPAKFILAELGKAFSWDDRATNHITETLGATSGE